MLPEINARKKKTLDESLKICWKTRSWIRRSSGSFYFDIQKLPAWLEYVEKIILRIRTRPYKAEGGMGHRINS